MDLKAWLVKEGRGSKTRLARKADVAYSTLLALEAGKRPPKLTTLRRVEEATGGEVTVAEMIAVATAPRAEEAA